MTFHQTRRLPAWFLALALLLACGCELDGAVSGHAVPAAAADLVREVAVTGTLTSHDFEPVFPPPIRDARSFKIIRMAGEGSTVKVGDEVIAFDTSELENTLKDRSSEAASLVAQLEQARSEAELDALKGRREIEQATVTQSQKSRLADKPAELTAGLDLRIASIDRDLAQKQIISLRERERARVQQSEAAQSVLREQLLRAQARVTELQTEIASMSVKAKRAGTIIYKPSWRGEKIKVGDSAYRGLAAVEIAALEHMAAQGQVEEVDTSLVSVGQRVGLRLEARPEKEYAGIVEHVSALLVPASPGSRNNVVQLQIKLTDADPSFMRPNMGFRGRIEIEHVANVLQIPIEAIQSTAGGPTVLLKKRGSRGAPIRTKLTLGRRSAKTAEVVSGLVPGDEVIVPSRDDDGAKKGGDALGRKSP